MTSSVGAVLARLPLFSQVSADLLAVLAAAAVPVALGRGEVLFHRGDECTGFFVVLRGQVKLAVTSAEGNEKVLEIIGAGETFAEGVMFADRPYPVTATALVASDLLSVPRRTVLDLIDAEPTFARRMLAGMSVRLHTMVADVSAMALHSGTQRVIAFLLAEAAPDDATLRGGGSAVVRLPAGKAVLASRLSLTPETFSRVLRSLVEQGLADVDGRQVTLPDLARLAAWSGA
ncbi:Crp/Fnr family transcriptional regulator [Kineosporia sp. R_H_3]|uniref:Crp/Fnr family transcriptional regulator n=1 Tax=Kineosporia sp. R_H_3 TaxID=1961848 RepID=UPI0018E912AF|nr:Crp/Fnr family transcriptional regulator [Kineosporia sp. R_H_3]